MERKHNENNRKQQETGRLRSRVDNTLPILLHEVPPQGIPSIHLLDVAELALAFLIILVAEGLLALPVLEVVLHNVELGAEETLVVAVAVLAARIPLIL